jgi:oligopeptide transport system permease protein
MVRYLFKRIVYMLITLWVIVTLTFILINVAPGNPIRAKYFKAPLLWKAAMNHQYGLDLPIFQRYINYLGQVAQGHLGESIIDPYNDVNSIIAQRFPVSARLGLQAIVVGLGLGILLGILAALHKGTWIEYTVNTISIVGMSVPVFVIAAILIKAATGSHIFPYRAWPPRPMPFYEEIRHTFMPTIVLSFSGIATYAKYMRASLLEVLSQDYILTAKSKGLSKMAVVWKHAMRNAIVPVVTMLGLQVVGVITGSFVVETMYDIPGLGAYFVYSINSRDYTMVMGLTIFFAVIFVASQVVVDFLYAIIDPRIRITGKRD